MKRSTSGTLCLLAATLAAASTARAQDGGVDGGLPPTDGVATDAVAADAGASVAEPSLASELDMAAGTAAPTTSAVAQSTPASSPSFQSLNPDISVILDADLGAFRRGHYSLAGDDPNILGASSEHPAGFAMQEVEVAFQAVADPYFRADLFLTIPNLEGIEVEEGFFTTTSLPWNLQVKAGLFRSALGRQNGQHLHLQDFTRRPLLNEAYLGGDGLRAPGLQLSWLLPTPFFLQLVGEAFSVGPPEEDVEHLTSFGGGKRTDLVYTVELKAFAPAGEELSFYGGLNAATGKSAGAPGAAPATLVREGARTLLQGADLYVKYKPSNVVSGYFSLAWQTEYFVRRVAATSAAEEALWDGGIYTQLVAQFARRWYLGVRQDFLGLPDSELQPRVDRSSLSLTFAASEFVRIRAYGERETTPLPGDSFLGGPANWGGYLQLEGSIGAHGAHPF